MPGRSLILRHLGSKQFFLAVARERARCRVVLSGGVQHLLRSWRVLGVPPRYASRDCVALSCRQLSVSMHAGDARTGVAGLIAGQFLTWLVQLLQGSSRVETTIVHECECHCNVTTECAFEGAGQSSWLPWVGPFVVSATLCIGNVCWCTMRCARGVTAAVGSEPASVQRLDPVVSSSTSVAVEARLQANRARARAGNGIA